MDWARMHARMEAAGRMAAAASTSTSTSSAAATAVAGFGRNWNDKRTEGHRQNGRKKHHDKPPKHGYLPGCSPRW